jgi:hypothetical protein
MFNKCRTLTFKEPLGCRAHRAASTPVLRAPNLLDYLPYHCRNAVGPWPGNWQIAGLKHLDICRKGGEKRTEDKFKIELINDSSEFDAISAESCDINDTCGPNLDYADGCTMTDDCTIDYS